MQLLAGWAGSRRSTGEGPRAMMPSGAVVPSRPCPAFRLCQQKNCRLRLQQAMACRPCRNFRRLALSAVYGSHPLETQADAERGDATRRSRSPARPRPRRPHLSRCLQRRHPPWRPAKRVVPQPPSPVRPCATLPVRCRLGRAPASAPGSTREHAAIQCRAAVWERRQCRDEKARVQGFNGGGRDV